jgi:transcriptional regulator with XRE-family HTH domain
MKKKNDGYNLGKIIHALRKTNGLTQAELAKKLSCSQVLVVQYEKGESRPSAAKLPLLAAALNVTIDQLYKGNSELKEASTHKDPKLWKRFERLQKLPPHEKSTVLKMIDGLLANKAK